MKIALIQLSDIHLVPDSSKNPVLARAKAIAAAINGVCIGVEHSLLVVSGDTAYSGLKEEYAHGQKLIEDICDGLSDSFKGVHPNVVTIPGNHDCDFTLADSVRALVLSAMKPDTIDVAVVKQCVTVQKNYVTFASVYDTESASTAGFDPLYRQRIEEVGGKRIVFHLFNSAWMSKKGEDPGHMYFPIDRIADRVTQAPKGDLAIAVIHHPFNWNWPMNGRDLRELLEDNADLILTGHEHVAGAFTKRNDDGEQNEYLEGGVLQETGEDDISSFNVVILDMDRGQQQTFRLTWDNDHYTSDGEALWRPFERNKRLTRSEFRFTPGFFATLEDPGTGFLHPRKEGLKLTDLFLYPDLREDQESKQNKRLTIKGRDVVAYLLNQTAVVLIGEERSGKTALSKMLMRDIKAAGKVPILLSEESLKNCLDDTRLKSKAETAINEHYGKGFTERYWQLEAEKRVVIVDDFHKVALNQKGKDKLIELLIQRFGHAIFLVGEEYRLEDFTSQAGVRTGILPIRQCTLLQFGHVARYDLVSRWCRLGSEYTVTEEDLEHRIEKAEKRVTAILSNDFLPSLPVYILILLQRMDSESKTALVSSATPAGSFGYLYEVLITMSLAHGTRTVVDIETKYNYLSEFAFRIFSLQRQSNSHERALSAAEIEKWHSDYCTFYHLALDFATIWGELEASGSLQVRHGFYRFRYKYLYYYFVARYFRDHIKEAVIQDHLRDLCARLHHEDAANIILFLCHLSKDESILNEVQNAAKQLFATQTPFNIREDTVFLNRLSEALPGLSLKRNQDVEANRRAHRERLDEIEGRKGLTNAAETNHGDTTAVSTSESEVEGATALKTIQILGQVVKNFSGSLGGEVKINLLRENYNLGLRLLGSVIEHAKRMAPVWETTAKAELEMQHEAATSENIIRLINRVVVMYIQTIVTMVIKHISDSIGTDKVAPSLAQIVSEDSNPSLKIIDVSIRLDHYDHFPSDEIKLLASMFRDNPFAFGVLRALAWLRLYMYKVDFSIVQRTCSALDIPIDNQVKLLSPRQKKGQDKRSDKK